MWFLSSVKCLGANQNVQGSDHLMCWTASEIDDNVHLILADKHDLQQFLQTLYNSTLMGASGICTVLRIW